MSSANGQADGTDVITVAEAAEILGWPPYKIFYHLELGRVPGARKVRGKWLISRAALLAAEHDGLL